MTTFFQTQIGQAAKKLEKSSATLKAYMRKQKVIARSSADGEFYGATLGASESKGVVPLLKDQGYEMKPVLVIDAKATEHIVHRQMQDEVRSKRLRSDLGSKPLSKAVVAKHCFALGYVDMTEENVECKRQDVAMSLGLGFDPHDRDGWQNSQHAAHSRCPCQDEFT